MKEFYITYYLKLLLNLASILLIVFGLVLHFGKFVIVGSIIFLISLFINTLSVITLARKMKDIKPFENETLEAKYNINNLLEGLLMLYGIVALVVSEPFYLNYSGQIIWLGAVLLYMLNGTIAGWITNIPLKMTHGGWKIWFKNRFKR